MASETLAINALVLELSQYLHLTSKVVLARRDTVSVGENFTVRFTLLNSAPPPIYVGQPTVRFKNPYLQLYKTEYARPVLPDGSAVDGWGHNFPVSALEPGEVISLDVPMLAIAEIAGWTDLFLRERIAQAWVHANLDADAYFLVTRQYNIASEIEPSR